MLIKPFYKEREDIDDIDNITQKNRYIFIYRYNAPHSCSYTNIIGRFNDTSNLYDVYLINDSQVDGVGFYIRRGIRLQNRNSYRGYAKDLILPDGKLNYDTPITFMDATYLNRVSPKTFKDDPDPLVISSIDPLMLNLCPGNSLEEELYARLGTDVIQPFPQFYNVEDQAWLSNKYKNITVGDFIIDQSICPNYTLRDLVDKYTKIAVIDIPSRGGNLLEQELYPYAADPTVVLNDGSTAYLEQLKCEITSIFIDVFITVSHSVFSAIDIIIDLESSEFSVIPRNVKFNDLPKDVLLRDKLRISMDISEKIDDIVEMTSDVPDAMYINNLCPNRLTIHIDNFNALIRLTNIYSNIVLLKSDGKKSNDHIGASGKISSSDADDMVKVFAVGLD